MTLAPKTIGEELLEDITALFHTASMYSKDDPTLAAFELRARQLAKADPRDGYLMLAAVAGLSGEFGEMRSKYRIAENQGLTANHKMNYASLLAHAGFFSESGAIVETSGESCNSLAIATLRATQSLHFSKANDLYAKAKAMRVELSDGDIRMFDFAEHLSRAMPEMELTDKIIASIGDIAGEIMRKHGVFHTPAGGVKLYAGDDGNDYLCASFHVPVSYDKASDMNFEFAEQIVRKNMLETSKSLMFRFVGNHECNA